MTVPLYGVNVHQREPDTAAAHRDSIGNVRDRCDTDGIVFDGSAAATNTDPTHANREVNPPEQAQRSDSFSYRHRSAGVSFSLFRHGNPVHYASPVIRHKERPVRQNRYTHGPPIDI